MDLSTTSFLINITVGSEDENRIDDVCSFGSDDWTFSVIPVYILLISVLGILLNVFVLMVFCLHKKPCTTSEIYLSNLAAADLVLVSFLPFWAANAWNRFIWTFGLALCKLVNVSILMNVYCSIFFIVLVSIDRFLTLVNLESFERIRAPFFAKLGCFVVWILGFLFSLPALIYREITSPGNETFCFANYPSPSIQLASDASISVFGFVVPVSIITFCTIKIIKALRGRITEGVNAKKQDQKATILALAVLLAFLICWVPFHLIKILFLLRDAGYITECPSLRILFICLQIFTYFAFFNSVLNPILYVIVGKNFQKKVRELFRHCDHNRNLTLNDTSASTKLSRAGQSEDEHL